MVETHTAKIKNLRQSEFRLRTIIERLAEGVTLYKLDGRLLFLTPTDDNGATWLRTTLENLAEGVELYDLDGNLLYGNLAVVGMYGFSSIGDYCRSQFEISDVFEFASLDGKVWSKGQLPLKRILHGENLSGLEAQVRNKRMCWEKIFNYSGILINDTNDKPLMVVLIIKDITEQKNKDKNKKETGAADNEIIPDD